MDGSVEHLRNYLDNAREQVEEIKNTQINYDFSNSEEREKLYKKITEIKNKRLILQQDLERKKTELGTLKDSYITNKTELGMVKSERNVLAEEKNSLNKEIQNNQKKLIYLKMKLNQKMIYYKKILRK